jgi:hypothetical protein
VRTAPACGPLAGYALQAQEAGYKQLPRQSMLAVFHKQWEYEIRDRYKEGRYKQLLSRCKALAN